MIFLYVILTLLATFLGAVTGMGGGVIIKPVLDLEGSYDAATIGILASVTVLAMSAMACIRQGKLKAESISLPGMVMLGLGSAGGGTLGQLIFERFRQSLSSDAAVKILQNSLLLALMAGIFVYMLFRERITGLGLKHYLFYLAVGVFLGLTASFLGIGGGPVNVAVLMLLFSLDIKSAAFGSIVTILFSQVFKLGSVLLTTGFGAYDLSALPYMVAAALAGAYLGSLLKKKLSENSVARLFNAMQIGIAVICVFNIVKLSGAF